MKTITRFVFLAAIISLHWSCEVSSNKQKILIDDIDIVYKNQKRLTDLIIYDVFSPPVAARIYSYTSLAAYETIRFARHGYPSITKELIGFESMPEPHADSSYNFNLAATRAFFAVASKLTFSLDTLKLYEGKMLEKYKSFLNDETYSRSIKFGEAVAQKILARAASDNYALTRGKPRFIGSNDPGKWRPTPPDYADAAEPFWGEIKAFSFDSSTVFKLPEPLKYNKDIAADFNHEVKDVYTIGKNLTPEQKDIAVYWDDNPFVVEHTGHMMYANKKITPGGHWMGIASIASKKINTDECQTARVQALTAVALMDGFISCWKEKYRNQLIRPVSIINETIDKNWLPFLQTPPFPEYPSGHSVISASAATVLSSLFGENFSFHDDSDKEYIGMEKDFSSFKEAASEASISRVYGGIHFRSSVDKGMELGNLIGQNLIDRINKKQ